MKKNPLGWPALVKFMKNIGLCIHGKRCMVVEEAQRLVEAVSVLIPQLQQYGTLRLGDPDREVYDMKKMIEKLVLMKLISEEKADEQREVFGLKTGEEQIKEEKFLENKDKDQESDEEEEDDVVESEDEKSDPEDDFSDDSNSLDISQRPQVPASQFQSMENDFYCMKRKYDELEVSERQKAEEVESLKKKLADLQGKEGGMSLISDDDLAIVSMEITEGVTGGVKEALAAKETEAKRQGRKIRNELQMLSKKVDVKFTSLTTGQDPEGAGKKGYTIPKVPTLTDLQGLQTAWAADLDKVKKELMTEMKSQKTEILDSLRKFAQNGGGTVCGICLELGHKGKDCQMVSLMRRCLSYNCQLYQGQEEMFEVWRKGQTLHWASQYSGS